VWESNFKRGTTRFKTVAGLNATQLEPWNADDIIFTAGRNPVLAGRNNFLTLFLPLCGRRQFDLVKARLAHKLKLQQEVVAAFNGINRSCCSLLCSGQKMVAIVKKEEQDKNDLQKEWLALVQSEQAKYESHGIHVTLLPEISLHGHRKHERQIKVNVGLKFEISEAGGNKVA